MKLIDGAIATAIKEVLGNLTGFVENMVVNKEDKAKIVEKFHSAEIEMNKLMQQTLTERHKNDMMSDSWLSKNIRPLFLVFTIVAFLFFALFDGNIGEFSINDSYRSILESWGAVAVGFYFGFRGLEKMVSMSGEVSEKLFEKRRRRKDNAE